jgi:hypothetical protein
VSRPVIVFFFFVALLGLIALGSCGGSSLPNARTKELSLLNPVYNSETGRLERLTYDADHDGRIDMWAYMDGARVKRVDVDENGDGRPDRFEYFDASTPPGAPPVVVRVEEATNLDGRLSRWEFYEHGVLRRVEVDTDGDGHPDKWEQYTGGRLTRVDLDLEHRGVPTRRLVYRANGSVDRVETVSETALSH